MSKGWYIRIGDEVFGPLSSKELKELARKGRLDECDFVRKAEMTNWVPVTRVQGLFDKKFASQLASDNVRNDAVNRALSQNSKHAIHGQSQIDFCCDMFKIAVSENGQAGSCIVLGRHERGFFVCEIEFRAFPKGVRGDIGKDKITTYVSQPIQYCPWCGENLEHFFGHQSLPTVEVARVD